MIQSDNIDKMYMRRCLQLAALGRGNTSPNPMVGAVVVCDGRIIGEGYHRKCGEAHAEVNAIRTVNDKELLKRSTIYVSLEPCSHWGKTPPCSKLIIEMGIPRVVIGSVDPFFEVSGRGIRMLREAGVNVTVGVLEQECLELNKAFFSLQEKGRPFVILKWAQSADGFIDRKRVVGSSDKPVKISDEMNSILVHKLRSETDAILVGTRTVELDDPQLTLRKWNGNDPVRVFLDRELKISSEARILDGAVRTLVITEKESVSRENVEYVRMTFDDTLIPTIMNELAVRKIQSVLVEGGASVLNSFINNGIWDEMRIEISPVVLEDGVKAPPSSGTLKEMNHIGKSVVMTYVNK